MKSNLFSIVGETVSEWGKDDVPRLAAALSYYTIFSIAPLLLLMLSIATIFVGHGNARQQLFIQIRDIGGSSMAHTISNLLAAQGKPSSNIVASLIGFVTLLLGASGIFGQLKSSLNSIWHVEAPKEHGLFGIMKDNLSSFLTVLLVGAGFVVILLISGVVNTFVKVFHDTLPYPAFLIQILDQILFLGSSTVLFAGLYKYLPNTKVKWSDIFLGAFVAAILFTVGKYLIGFYLAHFAGVSKYGATGSLVALLLWIFYCAQIFFFGAEFSKVYALHRFDKKKKTSLEAQYIGSFLEGLTRGFKKELED